MKVLYVSVGVGRSGMNGSRRYLELLRTGLQQEAEPPFSMDVLEGPRLGSLVRLREKLLLGSWSLTGFPRVATGKGPGRPALVHSVENVSVPRSGKLPLVVTVHDLCAMVQPHLVDSRVVRLVRQSWRRAHSWDALIVPSEATRSDAVALGIPDRRISLIRYGVSSGFTGTPSEDALKTAREISGELPFVLAVCPVSNKKGGATLVQAWNQAATACDGRLVWVSGGGDDDEGILKRVSDASRDRLVRVTNLSQEVLAALYRLANALVAPSRWEGYSFPVAEALAAGTPVIASDIRAHREFGDRDIEFFAPERPDELAELLIARLRSSVRVAPHTFTSAADFVRAHAALYQELIA